jgi:hypothetical protein
MTPPEEKKTLRALFTPQGLVQAATKAHPAFKFAVSVAGIAALVAIAVQFGISIPILVFGTVITLSFMFLFLIFSVAARAKGEKFGGVVLTVTWALAILFILILILLLTSAFFDSPIKLRTYIEETIQIHRQEVPPKHSDAELQALQAKVEQLQNMVLRKLNPDEMEHEAKLRQAQPDLFRHDSVFWPNGANIHVGFLSGTGSKQKEVLALGKEWAKYANINIISASTPEEADVRVTFGEESEWSFMGTQCLSVPKKEATMNLPSNWLDEDFRTTVLHAFGHVLGLMHEHQTPEGNKLFDWNRAYDYFAGPPMFWTKNQVDFNLRSPKAIDPVYSNKVFDPKSVMLYGFPSEIMLSGNPTVPGTKLSDGDISLARKIYPGR